MRRILANRVHEGRGGGDEGWVACVVFTYNNFFLKKYQYFVFPGDKHNCPW